MSNREKFKDNPLSAVCTTIYFDDCKSEDRLTKIAEHVPLNELMRETEEYTHDDHIAAIKLYKIPNDLNGKKDILGKPNPEKFIYFEIYGLRIKLVPEDPINWVLNIGNGESIADDADVYLLEMELLSWLLYEGYSIP